MVLSIDRCSPASLSLAQASEAIQRGGLVAYATETFFALGCSALNAEAMESIFAAKRREATMPLPVIIGNMEQVSMLSDVIGEVEQALMDTFWPAPLSILLAAKNTVPSILTGGTGLVAVRLSPHDGATRLAKAAGLPLVSTSANISGRPAVTCAENLDEELLSAISGYYDEGPCPQGGLPSTLVRVEQGRIRMLREGGVSLSALEAAGFCCL